MANDTKILKRLRLEFAKEFVAVPLSVLKKWMYENLPPSSFPPEYSRKDIMESLEKFPKGCTCRLVV
jgi:hypothetical protein